MTNTTNPAATSAADTNSSYYSGTPYSGTPYSLTAAINAKNTRANRKRREAIWSLEAIKNRILYKIPEGTDYPVLSSVFDQTSRAISAGCSRAAFAVGESVVKIPRIDSPYSDAGGPDAYKMMTIFKACSFAIPADIADLIHEILHYNGKSLDNASWGTLAEYLVSTYLLAFFPEASKNFALCHEIEIIPMDRYNNYFMVLGVYEDAYSKPEPSRELYEVERELREAPEAIRISDLHIYNMTGEIVMDYACIY